MLRHYLIIAACSLLTLAAPAVEADTNDSKSQRAQQWLETGLNERNRQKKIAAFTHALEIDPDFVEAAYNLGLVYKQQQDYARAEQFIARAHANAATITNEELKLAILYELATTYKRRNKLAQYEQTLRAAKAQAREKEMGGTIAFELGRFLYQQERWQEALVELREGERLYPAQAQIFANLIRLSENAAALQRLYLAAERAEREGKLQEAKNLYAQIAKQAPQFKNVQEKLAALTAALQKKEAEAAWLALYQRAQAHATAGNWERAINSYEDLLKIAGDFRDARARLRFALKQLERRQNDSRKAADEWAPLYDEGVQAFTRKNWAAAVRAFEQIANSAPNYRDVRKRLARAREAQRLESNEAEVERYYADGATAYAVGDLHRALVLLEHGYRLNPNYKNIATLLANTNNQLEQRRTTVIRETVPAAPTPQTDALYSAALAAIEQQDWRNAVAALEKLQQDLPADQEINQLLAEVRVNLSITEANSRRVSASTGSTSVMFIGGAVTGLLLLPLFGVMMFSPMARARFYLLQGNYNAAARIYENRLASRPNRVQLYSMLASIYLLAGRKDETAIKIYKTVLQLNLATRNRDEINTIVAQAYLSEGAKDTDAIKILEDALRAEVRNVHKKR
ncbi:tetratricopeptide repeat protein [bacterium]|nr:tetratricopeptide repeat protein [bacterium]